MSALVPEVRRPLSTTNAIENLNLRNRQGAGASSV